MDADNPSGCIFCLILAGQAPGSFVYRGERSAAFMDLHQLTPGHLLVVPTAHAANLAALPPEDGAELFRTAQQLAEALRRSDLRCDGVNFFLADGEAAGQDVFHVHLHVFPRFAGDGFKLSFPPGYGEPTPRVELDDYAAAIRRALDS